MAREQMTRVKLMGLWWNQTRDGQEYLRGRLGASTVWIFPNNYKDNDQSNEPDMIVYLSPGAKKKEDDERNPPTGGRRGGGRRDDAPPPPGDDDIPF